MVHAVSEINAPPDSFARGDFELIVRRLADDLAFGGEASAFMGGGVEYAGSRPYQPGDPTRALNWRLSARTGRPFVKEYEALRRLCVWIVVDTSASMAVSSGPVSKQNVAAWIASALGLVCLRRMMPVAVVGGGARRTDTSPSLRRTDLWRGIEPLRAAATDERTCVGEAVRRVVAAAPSASLIVVLSDLHEPGVVPAVRLAGQRHDCVVVRLADPAEEGPLRAGFVRAREAETGAEFLAEFGARARSPDSSAAELACAGVDQVTLRTDRSLLPSLRRLLSERGLSAGRGR